MTKVFVQFATIGFTLLDEAVNSGRADHRESFASKPPLYLMGFEVQTAGNVRCKTSINLAGLSFVLMLVLWNTTYLELAIQAMKDRGQNVDEALLPHLSPLGWEHINLTGNYTWGDNLRLTDGKYRPLRANDGNDNQDAQGKGFTKVQ